jgi:hypothetical protein
MSSGFGASSPGAHPGWLALVHNHRSAGEQFSWGELLSSFPAAQGGGLTVAVPVVARPLSGNKQTAMIAILLSMVPPYVVGEDLKMGVWPLTLPLQDGTNRPP